MDQNKEIFEKIIENPEFGDMVKRALLHSVYQKLNKVAI